MEKEPCPKDPRNWERRALTKFEEFRQLGTLVLSVKGVLDSNTSGDFEERLLALIGSGESSIIIDFDDVDYISSAGLRVIIKAVKEQGRKNGQLAICSMKDYVREVFDLCGFISLLPVHSSLEESLKALEKSAPLAMGSGEFTGGGHAPQ